MGEVWKARDTRLERSVAIKVLAGHLSASADVRQRFEREAKTISQLSHPHVCALHDVGREGDVEYLVMELLDGETLSERLVKGPLPLEQTLRYGAQIADALDKAHRQGIVHRDLKPGNVMLTKTGVKLLDFGLARSVPGVAGASSPGLTASPTQANLTEEGTILGTFQYMAPEQLEGRPPTRARTSSRSARRSTRWRPGGRPSPARRRRRSSRRSSATTLRRSRRSSRRRRRGSIA